MDFEKYKNTLPYPEKPNKPKEPKPNGIDAKAYRAHADAMDQYAKELEAYETGPYAQYKEQKDAYLQERQRLEELFKTDLLEELGITGHPKADQFYNMCYQKNHNGGFGDIAAIAHDFVDLMFYNVAEMEGLIKFRAKNGIRG